MKMFALVEVLMVILVALFVVTQILVPAIHSMPLFPLLRKRRLEAESELVDANEDAEIAKTQRKAVEVRNGITEPAASAPSTFTD